MMPRLGLDPKLFAPKKTRREAELEHKARKAKERSRKRAAMQKASRKNDRRKK